MTGYPAGWYPDPWGAGQLRYYDGTVWTPHVAPSVPQPLQMAPVRNPGRRVGGFTALAGVFILAIGAIGPWVTARVFVASVTRNGIEGDGQLFLGLAVLAGLFAIVQLAWPQRGWPSGFVVMLGALATVGGVFEVAYLSSQVNDLNANEMVAAAAQVGWAPWLLPVGGIVMIAGGMVALVSRTG